MLTCIPKKAKAVAADNPEFASMRREIRKKVREIVQNLDGVLLNGQAVYWIDGEIESRAFAGNVPVIDDGKKWHWPIVILREGSYKRRQVNDCYKQIDEAILSRQADKEGEDDGEVADQ